MSNNDRETLLFLSKNQNMIEKISDVINNINSLLNTKLDIPNIAMTYNNKMISFIPLFNKNNLEFEKSSIQKLIKNYFISKIEQATKHLEKCTNLLKIVFDSNLSENDKKFLYDEAMEHIFFYIKQDSKINNFTIEKDIYKALQSDITFYNNNEKKGGYNLYKDSYDEIIDNCNNELSELGFYNTYIDPDSFRPEGRNK